MQDGHSVHQATEKLQEKAKAVPVEAVPQPTAPKPTVTELSVKNATEDDDSEIFIDLRGNLHHKGDKPTHSPVA
jgi:hypothetical protein